MMQIVPKWLIEFYSSDTGDIFLTLKISDYNWQNIMQLLSKLDLEKQIGMIKINRI